MKKLIFISIVAISSMAFAKFDENAFKANLQKDLSVSRALFECVGSGLELNQVYNEVGLAQKSASDQCSLSISNALNAGATQEDFRNAINRVLNR